MPNRNTWISSQKQLHKRIENLRATRNCFDTLILRGQADQYRELFATKKTLIVGPVGSFLLAMVRIPVSGGRTLYRRTANRALFEDVEARALIQSRFLLPGMRLATWPDRNPTIAADSTDEILEKLEWHHSPNHIPTVCLIPSRVHRQTELHAAGRGGHGMFWIGGRLKQKGLN